MYYIKIDKDLNIIEKVMGEPTGDDLIELSYEEYEACNRHYKFNPENREFFDEMIAHVTEKRPNEKIAKLEKENAQLWDTVNFLLVNNGFINNNV